MPATVTVTKTDMYLEVANVSVNGVDCGGIDGGITVDFNEEMVTQRVDQLMGPVKSWLTLLEVTEIRFTVCENTYAKLKNYSWGSTLFSTGGTGVGIGGLYPGEKESDTDGVTIIIHPVAKADGTVDRDATFYKCISIKPPKLTWSKEVSRWELAFKPHLDTTKTRGKMQAVFGTAAAT